MKQQSSVKLAKSFAIIIGATAILVMIGWAFDIGFLKSISPSWIAMRLMTAVNFLLTAFILYYIAEDLEGRTGVAGVALPLTSFLSAIFMLSILYSNIFGIRTGLEEWFAIESGNAAIPPVPGRPAVPTIFNFILVALSGMVTVFQPANLKSILSWLGGIVAAIGAVACIGYLLDVPLLYYRIGDLDTVMAFHTTIMFVLFGAGLLLLSRQGEATPSHPDKKLRVADIKSPVRLMTTLMFGLFAIEMVVMGVFAVLPPMPVWYEILIDPTVIVVLFFPFLYLLVFRPFKMRDTQQMLVQHKLEKQLDELQRFHKVTISRELRMKELYEENQALKARPGEPE